MAAQTRTIPDHVLSFNSNNLEYQKLDRGWVYREAYLYLHGEVNISAGGSAGSNPLSPESIVKRLRIRKGSTDDVISADFHALGKLAKRFWPTVVGRQTIDPTTTGNQKFSAYVIVPFWMPQVVKPREWALNAINLKDLRIEVQWGTIADLVGDATATFVTEPQINVTKYVDVGGPAPAQRGWRFTNMVSQQITKASSNLRLDLTPGEMFRGFLIRTMSGATPAPARDVINELALKSGGQTFWELSEADLAYISNTRKDQMGVDAGYYFVDMLGDGYRTEALDTAGWQEIFLKADVNAPTGAQIDVYPLELLPTRNQG